MPILRSQRTYPLTLKSPLQRAINSALVTAYDFQGDPGNSYAQGNGVPHVGSKTLAHAGNPSLVAVTGDITGRDPSQGKTVLTAYTGTHIGSLGFGSSDGKGAFSIHRRYRAPVGFTGTTAVRTLTSWRDASGLKIALYMYETASGYIYFRWDLGGQVMPSSGVAVGVPNQVSYGAVVDLHLTRSGDTVKCFVNGVLVASATVPTLVTFNTDWAGSAASDGPTSGNPVDLIMIDTSYWARALTDIEVGQHQADPYAGYANSATVADGITITNPLPGSVVNSEGFTIAGTYAGAVTPTGIEARWNGGAWFNVDLAPTSGLWAGTAPAQTSAVNATLEARFKNDISKQGSATGITAIPPAPTVSITAQPGPDGQSKTMDFSTTRATSVAVTLQANGNGAVTQGPTGFTVTGSTASASFSGIQPGDYLVTVTATGAGGTATISGTAFSINGVGGGGEVEGGSTDPIFNGETMNYANRVNETTAATNTATLTLLGAVLKYRTLASAVPVGTTNIPLVIEDESGPWLEGLFTLTAPNVVVRTAITDSSNNGADVTFPAGVKRVYCDVPATQVAKFAAVNDAATSVVQNPAVSTIFIEEGGLSKRITMADFLTALGTTVTQLTPAGAHAGTDLFSCTQDGVNETKTTLSALAQAVASILGISDVTAPTASSAAVQNATPTVVNIAMSEALNASFVPAASAFTVGGHTVSSVAISGSTINLTVSAAFVNGEAARTVAYTQPGTNNARDVQGNLLANFTALAITNNVAAVDVVAPTASSAAVANATPTIVNITMSEAMNTGFVPAASAFTVGGHTVSSVGISGSSINLTLSAGFVNGEAARTVAYTQPGTNNARDVAGNLLANFTALAITNNVAAVDVTSPTAISAAVANATPTVVNVTMSESLDTGFVPAAAAFTVGGHTVSSVGITGSTINLTVSAAFVNGEAARTVAYTQPGTNNARDLAGNLLANFTALAVTNNVSPSDVTAPTASSAAVANTTPTVVNVTMSEAMDSAFTPAASAFTVGGHTVSSVAISGSTINLTVSAAFVNGEAASTVAYTQPGTNNARDLAGNLLANFTALAVTNNVTGTAYTITGYSGNAVKTTCSAATPDTTQGSIKGLLYTKTCTTQYWSVSPTPPGSAGNQVKAGWGTSSTVAPAEITQAQHVAGAASINGMRPILKPSLAWVDDGYLWVGVGSGTSNWYFWIKPSDGPAVCMNPSAALVVTSA